MSIGRSRHISRSAAAVALGLMLFNGAFANLFAAERTAWIDPQGIAGTLIIVGGGKIPLAVEPEQAANEAKDWLTTTGLENITLAPAGQTSAETAASLDTMIRDASGVWLCGGQQQRVAAAFLGTPVEEELQALLQRGGVIGGTSNVGIFVVQ